MSLGASDRAAMRCALYWCDLELHPSLQRTTASASIALLLAFTSLYPLPDRTTEGFNELKADR
ncbi:hypothetical protein AVDCRST_MAG94-1144 [uncultured Leptolyngbya sp.]|uniref:Uncharacterized protein n=1 Tax=uncultured Leptolyngbya sp. TaxID=332963 RepID=A0A6J4KUG9_9CYAN|nr:hypothetical protein AVDCRST_MAG94-1144 [uncultured Leptolyngbya sp.]